MQGKHELEKLLDNIKRKMTRFDSTGAAQNQEMDASLKNLEDNFLEGALTEQDEYFVGRFAVDKEMRNPNFPIGQHIAIPELIEKTIKPLCHL